MAYPVNFGVPLHNGCFNAPYPKPIVVVTNQYGVQVHQSNDQQPFSNQQQQQQQPPTHLHEDEANLYSRRQYSKKNRPQSNAITPACMIASAAGIHFSYINVYIKQYDWYYFYTDLVHVFISWFIGLMIGAIISSILARKLQKKTFNYLAIILTIISGAIFVARKDSNLIITGRYLAGIGYGLILIPVLMHSGEISVKKLRGEIVSNIHICFIIGILTGSIFYAIYFNGYYASALDIHQLYGIGILVFGAIAFIYNTFMTIESPLYLMDKGNENDAFKTLLKLRKEKFETERRRQEFNDLRDMFIEDKILSTSAITQKNLQPLLIIGALRCLYALHSSIPLNYHFISSVEKVMSPVLIELIIISRLIGELFSWWIIDRKGRRSILRVSMILCGACTILAGIQFTESIGISHSTRINFIFNNIAFFYQFFLGLGFGTVSLTYMTEAFPFVKKPNSLLLIVIFENVIHLITIYFFTIKYNDFDNATYFYMIGALSISYALFIFKFLPETKNLTLRQCRDMMR